MTGRRRLDAELVRRGLSATRSEARDAIEAGLVTVAGRPAPKPGTLVSPDEPLRVERRRRYASRGGEKLAPALDRFAVEVRGRRCLDAGASTGGFTDVLLSRGAEHVAAVDVGYGQLSWRLRENPRVTTLERTNVRTLRREDLPYRPEVVLADLSFISVSKVLPALAEVAVPGADFVLLVKPQFEAGPADVGRGGVVRNPGVWRRVLEEVMDACRRNDLGPLDLVPSALPGPAGNVEFFLHARLGAAPREVDVEAAIAAAPQRRTG